MARMLPREVELLRRKEQIFARGLLSVLSGPMDWILCYVETLAGLPVFARNSCSIISHITCISGRFSTLLNCLPHTPPPPPHSQRGLEGLNCLAYVHSQMNQHTCAKFGPDRSSGLASVPHFLICDPLTPYKCSLMSRGVTFLTYIHSQMDLPMCAEFGPNRSSCMASFLHI